MVVKPGELVRPSGVDLVQLALAFEIEG
jgi:hypothetical protein